MRWITEKEEFQKLLKDARRCVYMDSGRIPTNLQRLQFDDAFFQTDEFAILLKTLMEWAALTKIYFTVLDPDPEYYFHDRFGKYPCFEIERTDLPEKFIEALSESYTGNPSDLADNLWTIRWEFVFTSPEMPWFVHALQSNNDNGGHLWVPRDWPQKIFEFDRRFIEAHGSSGDTICN